MKFSNFTLMLACSFCVLMSSQASGQFKFRFVQSTSQLSSLDDALDLLSGQNVVLEQSFDGSIFDLVDANSFNGGLFSYDLNLFGDPTLEQNNFAIEVIAEIEIDSAGTYTFGMNIDDGGRLEIDLGNGLETIIERTTTGSTEDFYGQAIFSSPGSYPIKIVYWENAFAANLEVYAALGSFDEFDESMRLLGDVNNGGLSVIDKSSRGDINCDGVVDFFDIQPFINILAGVP